MPPQAKSPEVGDLIVIGVHRVGAGRRTAEILALLGDAEHPHYRVRWDDGHESLFYPGSDATISLVARRPEHEEVARALTAAGVTFDLLPHPRAETASAEAAALGVEADEVGKTLVVKGEEGRVRVVLPASERIGRRKLREALGADKEVRLATEDEIADWYPDFELGSVPPVGGPEGEPVVVDSRIAAHEHVILEAGTHDLSLRVAVQDLLRATDARVADVCAD
jgi:prolyl-tRNA editing enzyme YbaK/EbsC (Cys-tRNA(Pro) deacylase)